MHFPKKIHPFALPTPHNLGFGVKLIMSSFRISAMMKKLVCLCASFSCLIALSGSLQAALSINVGNTNLLPNTPGQAVELFVTGGDLVQGMNLYTLITDGFSVIPGSTMDGPNITGINLTSGTIFSGNNTGGMFTSSDQYWISQISTSTGTVSANGLIATLTVDTTGFNLGSGPFSLKLSGTPDGDTDFAPIPITITNGQLSIIPEPSTWALAACLMLFGIYAHFYRSSPQAA